MTTYEIYCYLTWEYHGEGHACHLPEHKDMQVTLDSDVFMVPYNQVYFISVLSEAIYVPGFN